MAAINLDIGGNTRRLDRDIQKTVNRVYSINLKTRGDQPLGRITGKVNEFNKSLDASNARVIAFGASAGIIFGVQRAFSALVGATIEVQKSLQDINVILNVSARNLQKFGGELFNIAKNTGQSFQEVAKAATEFSRQGLGVEETLKRTNEALILSRLSGLDAAKSVEALTAAVNSYASQAVTATEVVNKFANVDAAFAVSSADLAEALQRVGSSAAQSGVSLNELIAIVTSAQQTTARGGAVIGNSFKTIFTRLQRGKVVDLLGTLGISDTNAGGQLKSTIQLLQDLGKVYDTLGSRQQAYVAEQVGGVFQINILKAALADLGKEYSIYSSALNVAAGSTDQAIRRNEELNKTYATQINALKENARQVASTAGERLIGPSLDRLVGGTNTLLEGLGEGDGKGIGTVLGKGILDGLGQFIAGPGIALIGGVLLKLFRDLGKFATGSVQQLLGLNTAATQQRDLQASISSILAKNPDLLNLALKGEQGINTAANTLLASLRNQTLELQNQEKVAQRIAKAFAAQAGVRVSGGVPIVPTGRAGKAAGYIPNFAEVSQAIELGAPSSVQSVPGVGKIGGKSFEANNKEFQMPNFAGTGETAVIPKYGGGIKEATKMIARGESGSVLDKSDRNKSAGGFIPNFAKQNNDNSKVFGAGRVFENAVGLAAGLQKEYVEDNFILDYEPNVWAGKADVKKILGINQSTNYGDAKLSSEGNNLTSYLSKIIRYDSGLRGVKNVGNIKNLDQKFGLRKRSRKSEPNNINLSQPKGGAVILPGITDKDGLKDKRVTISATLDDLIKTNSSIKNVFAKNNKYGINLKDNSNPTFSVPNVLLDTTNVPRGGTFGAKTRKEREDLARKAKDNVLQRKSFASGFIPNFAAANTLKIKDFKKSGRVTADYDKNSSVKGGVNAGLIAPGLYSVGSSGVTKQGKGYGVAAYDAVLETVSSKGAWLTSDRNTVSPAAMRVWDFYRKNRPDVRSQELPMKNWYMDPKFNNGEYQFPQNILDLKKNKDTWPPKTDPVWALQNKYQLKNPPKKVRKTRTFAEGFIPNFAKIIDLGDTVTSPLLKGKVSSLIHPKVTGSQEKRKVTANYLGQQYQGLVTTAGINQAEIENTVPNLEKNLGRILVDEANQFGQAIGGQNFLKNPDELPNYGAVKGAVGTAFEGGVTTLLQRNLQKSSQTAGIDFTQQRMTAKMKRLFHGAPGTYEAKYSPDLANEVLGKMLRAANVGGVKKAKSGPDYKATQALRAQALKNLEGLGLKRGKQLNAAIDKEMAKIKREQGMAAGYIPNFAAISDVMALETAMSGEKAIFDTKPFPHVRNKSQPTFGSAMADHGGKKQALKDSLMGQKRAGLASGFIPNFAIEDPDVEGSSSGTGIAAIAAQLTGLAFAFAFSGNQFKDSLRDLSLASKAAAESQRKSLADKIRAERVAARGASRLGPNPRQIMQPDGSFGRYTGDTRQQSVMAVGRRFQSERESVRRQSQASGAQRIGAFGSSNALGLAMAAPILGETIKNVVGQETAGNRQTGAVASGLGQIGSFAATGALIAPGPIGAGVGAAIGALLTIPTVVNEFTSELPELSAAARKSSQELTKFSDVSSRILTGFSKVTELSSGGGVTKSTAKSSGRAIENFKRANLGREE